MLTRWRDDFVRMVETLKGVVRMDTLLPHMGRQLQVYVPVFVSYH